MNTSVQDPKLYRFVVWPIWFVIVPLVLAHFTVRLLSPGAGFEPVTLLDRLLWAIDDQPIPATIGFFTLFEMLVYHYRHVLPFAATDARKDVPRDARREIERAAQLLDEADRVLRRQRQAFEQGVPAPAREELLDSLEALRRTMTRTPFDKQAFADAHDRGAQLVHKHLGRWQKGELR